MTETITTRIPVVLRSTSPVHHGAGTSGNTQLLRMQDFLTDSGVSVRVPFVSGNSLRHAIRAALAWTLVETIDVEDGALSKSCVDLLWSGGSLSQPGAQTDLGSMRERHELLPMLALLGYSHGPDIVSGTLRVSHAHLWCGENQWRLADRYPVPDGVEAFPAAEWLGEEFGTRHDVAGTPVDRLTNEESTAPTTQMIYDFQVVSPGAHWMFSLRTDAATRQQADALAAAISRITVDGGWPLAAKTATGFGETMVEHLDASGVGDLVEATARHVDHIVGHRDAILDLLGTL